MGLQAQGGQLRLSFNHCHLAWVI